MSTGSSGLWTPANKVTVIRVAGVPIWLLLAEVLGPGDGSGFYLGAFVVFLGFVALSLTDKLDGYLARSRNEITTFGKFLDPIADKLVVVVALAYLLEIGVVSSWVLLVIVAREFLVSGLRMVVASKGVVVAASNLGKWKTATTMVSICGLLLMVALPADFVLTSLVRYASTILLVIALVLTIWSGLDYTIKGWSYVVGDE